jgi:AcrR family transcriptional regulator
MALQDRMRTTKERIFKEAMALFMEKGFSATQVNEIAEKSGIAKGTFFNYFPTKESLFGYIGEMNIDALREAVESGTNKNRSVEEILADQAKKTAAWADANRAIMKEAVDAGVFTFGFPGRKSENRTAMKDLIASVIDYGKRRGEIARNNDVRISALIIEGTYFAIISDWARDESDETLASRLKRALATIFTGLRA